MCQERGGRCRGSCASSADHALVVAQHHRALHTIRKNAVVCFTEHGLDKREDALARGGHAGQCEDKAGRLGPVGDGRIVHLGGALAIRECEV